MNKVLVFTNAQRWNQLKPQFDTDDSLWNAKYNTIAEKLVLKYGINDEKAILEELPNLAIDEEGIYFVYDTIDATNLKQLLSQCADDEMFALIHDSGINKSCLGDGLIVLKGCHDTEDDHYYYPLFDLLTSVEECDTVAEKMYRIIDEIFLDEVIIEFLQEFSQPGKDMEKSSRYRTISNIDRYKEALATFKKKYEPSQSFEEYKEDLFKLREVLLRGKL